MSDEGREATAKPWAEGVQPTPQQALDWLRACTDDEGTTALALLIGASEKASRCFTENHDGRIKHAEAVMREAQRPVPLPPKPDKLLSGSARSGRRATVVTLTAEEIKAKLTRLRADREEWDRLADVYGSVMSLDDEIESYEWLLGGDGD